MNKQEYDREYYRKMTESSKRRKLELQYERVRLLRTKVSEYKSTIGCKNCGIMNPIVLEFDHRDEKDKLFDISQGVSNGYGWNKLLTEINKCDILCANCHRIKTSETLWSMKP